MRPRKIVRPKTVQHRLKLAKSDAEMYETHGARRTPSARPARQAASHLSKLPCVLRVALAMFFVLAGAIELSLIILKGMANYSDMIRGLERKSKTHRHACRTMQSGGTRGVPVLRADIGRAISSSMAVRATT